MHNLLLVTISMSAGATSEDARFRAHARLIEDDSFCGDGGRFGSPLCDWFIIGGRWSGVLRETLLGAKYQAAFQHTFPQFANKRYPRDLIDKHRDQLNQFWHRFGGKDDHPITRRGGEFGCEDDAVLLDRRLYDHFLKDHAGMATNLPGCGALCDFADLDDELLDESFIGRKWLVAVDYHY
jgi:hypothetical protein